jgi:hypothetical protein
MHSTVVNYNRMLLLLSNTLTGVQSRNKQQRTAYLGTTGTEVLNRISFMFHTEECRSKG